MKKVHVVMCYKDLLTGEIRLCEGDCTEREAKELENFKNIPDYKVLSFRKVEVEMGD